MQRFPLTSLSTLLIVGVFFWTIILVGQARTKYSVAAPAVSGNEAFERCFRVQMNTLEQLAMVLPVLWLCAVWAGDTYAAAGGAVWAAARVIYGVAYRQDPKKRGAGFIIGLTATLLMALATTLFIIRSLL